MNTESNWLQRTLQGTLARMLRISPDDLDFLVRARFHPIMVPDWQVKSGAPMRENLPLYNASYSNTGLVYLCVSAIAGTSAMVPLTWYEVPPGKTDKEKVELPYDHELVQLFRTVNPQQTRFDFMEAMAAYLELDGNFFAVQEPPGPGAPKELWPLDPTRVAIYPAQTTDSSKVIAAYGFMGMNGKPLMIPAEEVIHIKTFNPNDPFRGQGTLTAAREALTFDKNASAFNNSLLRNDGHIGGVLQTEQKLGKNEMTAIREEWEKRHQGPDKAGLVAVLHSGLQWKQTQLSPKDLQWLMGRKYAREEALAIFKVPPVIAGVLENVNYATASTQVEMFWTFCILLKQAREAESLSQWASARWKKNILAVWDYSGIKALQEDQAKKATTWQIHITTGAVSQNEYRAAFNMQPRGGLADSLWVPQTMMPMEGSEETVKPRLSMVKNSRDWIESEERSLRWNLWVNQLAPWERTFAAKVKGFFTDLEHEVTPMLPRNRGKVWDLIEAELDQDRAKAALAKIQEGLIWELLSDQTKKAIKALGIDMDFELHNPMMVAWVKGKQMTFANEVLNTTMDQLKTAVLKAEASGATIDEAASLIQDSVAHVFDMRRQQALTIARTEIISAANKGQQDVWDASGVVEAREWLTARDEKVRPDHVLMDGEVAQMGEPYSNGMMFPGDPNADLDQFINCRCTELARISTKAKADLVIGRIEALVYPGRGGRA